MDLLHFNGPVWRPPYEAYSQLLQVTAGCTHHRCKFCTLYGEQRFRLSPLTEVEADLQVIRKYQPRARRVFLTGANPFVLNYEKLAALADLIHDYLPRCRSIGCFARITDIRTKTDDQLHDLRQRGFDGLSIGMESGDDEVLRRMNKGYSAADVSEQLSRIDQAGIRYSLFYLIGLAGKGGGLRNARHTAELLNRTRPCTLNFTSLTVFPEAPLYAEIQRGEFTEAPERERLEEVRELVSRLTIEATLLGNSVSNVIPFSGQLPTDRARLLREFDAALTAYGEKELRRYRDGIRHL